MKPIIKWPGGKSQEIPIIINYIPNFYERYIEPFLGGGALYFYLEPKRAVVNDIDKSLIFFYRMVKIQEASFIEELEKIGKDWEDLLIIALKIKHVFIDFFKTYRRNNLKQQDQYIEADIEKLMNKIKSDLYNLRSVNAEIFMKYLYKTLFSKIKRLLKLEKKHMVEFSEEKLFDHLETAIKSAYYTYMRDEPEENPQKKIARFYFIREYCYGSMFRFNKAGKFNIPYGGIQYNKKSFLKKIEKLKSLDLVKLLHNTEFYNTDFEVFLNEINPMHNDFVFFDPPYDTEFKDYGKNPFSKDDHKRLAKIFANIEAPSVLIIKRTNFIFELYSNLSKEFTDIEINDYNMKYSYNVRGRNKREVQHLLITNFSQKKYFPSIKNDKTVTTLDSFL